MNPIRHFLETHALRCLGWATGLCFYAGFAGVAVMWAITAHTPCESNFEGGCHQGKALVGMGSFLAAGLAALCAGGLIASARSLSSGSASRRAVNFTLVLGAVPALYLLYCLGLMVLMVS